MKKLLLVSILAASFIAFANIAAAGPTPWVDRPKSSATQAPAGSPLPNPLGQKAGSEDEPTEYQVFVVTGKPATPKGIVIEKVNGASPTWKLVGFAKELNVRVAMLSDGSPELRRMDPDSFVYLPPLGASFKLAQIDGKGKYLPVNLVNIDGKEDGRLAWVLVTE